MLLGTGGPGFDGGDVDGSVSVIEARGHDYTWSFRRQRCAEVRASFWATHGQMDAGACNYSQGQSRAISSFVSSLH